MGSALTTIGPERPSIVELGDLGIDRGGHLLVDRALATMVPGAELVVRGRDPHLALHLGAWARRRGHRAAAGASEGGTSEGGTSEGASAGCVTVVKGVASAARWQGSTRAGGPTPAGVWEKAPSSWGLAARGALVERGGPDLHTADLDSKSAVWSDLAPKLYAQATAAQWDPATTIDWAAAVVLPPEVEGAVVQVMTYLVENEQAALLVPAQFLGRVHPHYRETMQFLAVQLADEARHIEVFSRRALLVRQEFGTSGAGGRASLQTLLDEREFSVASFLLSVLGEGTFLHLLAFIARHAPDPVTAQVCQLALQDEARHVAFGLAHLEEQLGSEPDLRHRLRLAVQRRHDALASTSGLNDDVLDALIVLAAGEWSPAALGKGYDAVTRLQAEMDEGRQRRLSRLGFSPGEAAELSSLHTRNFM